jgi:hypothetical protein
MTSPNPKEENTHPSETSSITAQILGFSGLLPIAAIFISAILWPQFLEKELLEKLSLLANLYAGTIFSFLGGIQWGLSLNPTAQIQLSKRLLVSVAPSLWTVAALQFASVQASWLLVLGLNALLLFELLDPEKNQRPAWYIRLRINLTLCLSLGLLAISALHFV